MWRLPLLPYQIVPEFSTSPTPQIQDLFGLGFVIVASYLLSITSKKTGCIIFLLWNSVTDCICFKKSFFDVWSLSYFSVNIFTQLDLRPTQWEKTRVCYYKHTKIHLARVVKDLRESPKAGTVLDKCSFLLCGSTFYSLLLSTTRTLILARKGECYHF